MSDDEEEMTGSAMIPVDGDLINLHESSDEVIRTFTLAEFAELGVPAPLADPETMRALYAYRRKMVTAMLNREHDFLYTIAYQEQGKNKEKMTTSYKEALKYSETYKVPYKAVPKKSGIEKLATAFGVEARIVEQKGLPVDPSADYSYVKYEIVAKKSGARTEGVGWARRNERGYPMPEHHMMGLADTRAYGRGVLRLAGFGEAGAEEIGGEVVMPTVRIEQGPMPKRMATNSESSETLEASMPPQETRVPVAATQQAAPAPQQQTQASPRAPYVPPEVPMPSVSTITEAQVGKLSTLLRQKLGSKERAVAWLVSEVKVDTTRAVPEAAYADLVKKLEAMEAP